MKSNVKLYHVDFNGNVAVLLRVEDNKVSIVNAMDGYGNPIDIEKIKVEEEPMKDEFVPFEKVLVRGGVGAMWVPQLFSCMIDGKYYAMDGEPWDECISYEGNEHLAGQTTDLK